MEEIILKCICRNKFLESEFKDHFKKCHEFKDYFSDFDTKLSYFIKRFCETKENLLLVRYILKLYIEIIEKKLKISFPKINTAKKIYKTEPKSSSNKKPEKELCQICEKDNNIIYLECIHPMCNTCFEKEAEKDFFNMKCKKCSKDISEKHKKEILKNKFENLEKMAIFKVFDNELVTCPTCGQQNYFESSKVDYNIKDKNGLLISKQSAENYANNRCKCVFCEQDFCIKCLKVPYHLGMICEEYGCSPPPKRCKYCDENISNNNKGPTNDICNSSECKEKYNISCKKTLPCGHKCFGVNGEKDCPPCLYRECSKSGQYKENFCFICLNEDLINTPIVISNCGHYLHYHCIKKRLETKWIGPKINFNYLMCPICNIMLDLDSNPELQNLINENKKLYEIIKEMSLKRLKYEKLDKDPRLTDIKSPWFNKVEIFAMESLSYFMCYVCKKPYFAGRRECCNEPNGYIDDSNPNYKIEYCICGKDSNLTYVEGKNNCIKHGKDFIEYKCKFCCKIAAFFCWGSTHFCEDCYKRQSMGEYLSKYTKEKLSKCNKDTCEVGGNHAPNGEEFALGCYLCRSNGDNSIC